MPRTSSIILILCRLALLTIEPSNSTSSNTATGVSTPVLPIVQSISTNLLLTTSSANLKAIAFLKWCAVNPNDLPYSILSNLKTIPSIG